MIEELDFTADKLLVNVTAISLALLGIIPYWVAIVFFVRDLLTYMGGVLMLYKSNKTAFKPTFTGKMSLFFQLVALTPAIMHFPDMNLLIIAAAVTVVSAFEAFFKSEFRRTRKKSDLSQFSLVKMVKVADLLSLANVVCGLISIIFAINGSFAISVGLLVLAVIFDFFDGKVARMLNQQHDFGKELDSLADTISFGVAPAVFAYSYTQFIGVSGTQEKIAIIAFTIFVFCGILRLARYNVMHVES